jgi:hypothetical protein
VQGIDFIDGTAGVATAAKLELDRISAKLRQ